MRSVIPSLVACIPRSSQSKRADSRSRTRFREPKRWSVKKVYEFQSQRTRRCQMVNNKGSSLAQGGNLTSWILSPVRCWIPKLRLAAFSRNLDNHTWANTPTDLICRRTLGKWKTRVSILEHLRGHREPQTRMFGRRHYRQVLADHRFMTS